MLYCTNQIYVDNPIISVMRSPAVHYLTLNGLQKRKSE